MSACRLVLMALLLFVLSPIARADAPALPDQPHIVVVGEGWAQAEADSFEVRLSVTLADKEGPAARAAVDERVAAVLQALRELGLEEEQVSISPMTMQVRYDYRAEPPKVTGFEVERSIDLTSLQIETAERLLDSVLEAGVTGVSDMVMRSERHDELAQEAQTKAIRDGRDQAEALAAGFGRSLGSVYGLATDEARYWSWSGGGFGGGGARAGGGSIFGDPGDDITDVQFTPEPVAVGRTVYAVFLLGPELPEEEQGRPAD